MKAREATLGQVYTTPEGQRVRVVSLLTDGVVVRYLTTHNLRLLPNDFELNSEDAEKSEQTKTSEVSEAQVEEAKVDSEAQVEEAKVDSEAQVEEAKVDSEAQVEEEREKVEEQEVLPAEPIDLEAEKQDSEAQEGAAETQTENQDAAVLNQVLSKVTSPKGVSTKDPQFLQMLLEGKSVSEIAKALGKEYRRVYNAVRMLKRSAEKKGKDFNTFLSERLQGVTK